MQQRWQFAWSCSGLHSRRAGLLGSRALTSGLPQVPVIAAKLRAVHPGPGLPPVIRAAQLDPRVDIASIAAAASPVAVVDADSGACLGWGLWNPHTHQYRVRVLEGGILHDVDMQVGAADLLRATLERRLASAAALRRTLLGLPGRATNVFRLVNREGDHLSGLAVDVLAEDVVVRSSAIWAEIHRVAIEESLRTVWPAGRLLWQQEADSLMQDGFKVHFGREPEAEDSASDSQVTVFEAGVKYLVSPGLGKKTGHFADQRENRSRLREVVAVMAKERDAGAVALQVLDLFCYSGGFAINAALGGGAGSGVCVTAVDMDAAAVQQARQTAVANEVEQCIQVVHANAFIFLQDEATAGRLYDVVVCDPPRAVYGSGWSERERSRAIGYHRRITRRCLQVLRRGGLLVTCTCSQVMSEAGLLLLSVQQAAAVEGRSVRLLWRTGTGGDHTLHPAWRPRGHLEVLWLEVQ